MNQGFGSFHKNDRSDISANVVDMEWYFNLKMSSYAKDMIPDICG